MTNPTIRLISKPKFRRVIKLYDLDMEVIHKFATGAKWAGWALVIKKRAFDSKTAMRKEINLVAHRFGWPISARQCESGVEVYRYA
jgi:hypothetical protein